jgi:UDP-N-acetylmuramate dehydrogenase
MKSQELKIQENILLAPYTTFKIGGQAKYFTEVSAEEALCEAVQYAKDNNLPAYVIGGGSNVLFSDKGFDGLVIKLVSQSNGSQPIVKMRMENGSYFLECWAGESLSSILKLASESSLSGLEWSAGIPGTVGGAVRGNAGAFGNTISDNVENVRILEIPNIKYQISNKLQITNLKLQDCAFSYRNSVFKENNNLIITSVALRLQKGDKTEIEAKIRENIKKRAEKQPQGLSTGSFFKNPVCKDENLRKQFEADTGIKLKDDKIPAGWLIAEAGFFGKKVGNVKVSENHGNFVINLGSGKAEEVVMLSSMIKQKIREEFNIQLVEEVQYVGF